MATSLAAAAAARRLAAHCRNPAVTHAAPPRAVASPAHRILFLWLTLSFLFFQDHHGPSKVNIWEDLMSPSRWEEKHFVIASLSGWVVIIYGGYKLFSGGKKDKKEEKLAEASH